MKCGTRRSFGDGCRICRVRVGFNIRQARPAEVAKDQMNISIKGGDKGYRAHVR